MILEFPEQFALVDLSDAFDWDGFADRCRAKGLVVLPPAVYLPMIGTYLTAIRKYGADEDPKAAYAKYLFEYKIRMEEFNGYLTGVQVPNPFLQAEDIIAAEAQKEYDAEDSPARGLGDTVARIAKVTGAVRLAEAYTKLTGWDCGCKRRQTKLNEMFPYGAGDGIQS